MKHPIQEAWGFGSTPAGEAAAEDIPNAGETYFVSAFASVNDITTRDLERTRIVLIGSGATFSVYRYDPENTDPENGVTVVHDSEDRPFVRLGTGADFTGFDPRGAYDDGTSYELLDLVTDQNASWVYIGDEPESGNAPPTLPATANAYWQLIAAPGTDGEPGPQGIKGDPAGAFQVFDASTSEADPGDGKFRLNNADLTAVSEGYFDNLDADGGSIAGWLDSFDNNNHAADRGRLEIRSVDDRSVYATYLVFGTVEDGSGYRSISLEHIDSAGPFDADAAFALTFIPTGDKGEAGNDGADGVDPGYPFQWSDTTSETEPTLGQVNFNHASLGSVTKIIISGFSASNSNPDISAVIRSWDDGGNASNRGRLLFKNRVAPEETAEFRITGVIVDHTDWFEIPAGFVGGPGLTDNAFVSVEFTEKGETGADGEGAVDTVNSISPVGGNVSLEAEDIPFDDTVADPLLGPVANVQEVIDALLQALDNVAFTGDYSDLSGLPTLGDLAALNSVGSSQIDNDAVTNDKLRDSAAVSVIGRSANSTGGPADIAADANGKILGRLSNALGFATLSDFIDAIGSTQGSILYRGASGWAILTPGTSGHVLTSNGAGANPSYQAGGGGSFQPIPSSNATIGVGSVVAAANFSGGTVNSESTTAGSGLRPVYASYDPGSGNGGSLPGTWRNIGGANCTSNQISIWVRTA
jgi:hypothetical protein